MKLERLEIRRLPGIRDPFAIEALDPGVNLIIGRNGAGKTSICRAVEWLLWRADGIAPSASVRASFRAGETELSAELESGRTTWQHDGQPDDPPEVPDAHLARCFTIGIDDLRESSDQELAKRTLIELSGGYDLNALRDQEGLRVRTRSGRRPLEQLRDAQRHLAKLEGANRKLAEREERLEELEQRCELARAAWLEHTAMKRGLEHVAARRIREEAERQLTEFPDQIADLNGSELGDLEDARELLAGKRKAIEANRIVASGHREAIEHSGLPADGLPEVVLNECDQRLKRLRRIEDQLADLAEMDRESRAQLREAERALGNHTGTTIDLDPAALAELEHYLRDRSKLASELRTYDARLGMPAPGHADVDRELLREAIGELRRWLVVPPGETVMPPVRRWSIVGLAALAAITAVLAATWLHPAWLVLLAPLPPLLFLALRPPLDRRPARRQRHAQCYERIGFEPPSAWSDEAVEDRVGELLRELASAEQAHLELRERERLQGQRERRAERFAAIEQKRPALLEQLGLDPALALEGPLVLARNILDYQRARRDLDVLDRKRRDHESAAAALLAALGEHLGPYASTALDDATAIEIQLHELRRRSTDLRRHTETQRAAEREIARDEASAATLEATIESLFERAGVARGHDAELRRRVGLIAPLRAAQEALQQARGAEHHAAQQLEGSQEILHMDEEDIRVRIGETLALHQEYERLVGEIQSIRNAIDEARTSGRLSAAIAAEEGARGTLEEALEESLAAAAGAFLIDEVERDYAVAGRPAVLERAADWFRRFTHHTYDLELDLAATPSDEGFLARESASREIRQLEQLSSGTRMQLLLAIRLAFAMEAERGVKLPFFLDEALSNSDPLRFREVVHCLEELASRDDRQIIYLTCQPGDVLAWNAALERGERRVIDLDALRRDQGSLQDPAALAFAALPEPPATDSLSAEEYALALGVDRFDPQRGAGGVHLYYLLEDDLELLRRLLRGQVDRAGKLQNLLASPAAALYVPDEEQIALLRSRLELLGSFAKAWKIGRGEPIDAEVLQSASVSEVYLEALAAIAAEHEGDAAALLAVIEAKTDERTKGFRSDKLAELRAGFLRAGHLDEREVLDEEHLCQAVMADAATAVQALSLEEALRLVRAWNGLAG